MVPGFFTGLEDKRIDHNILAYRAGVILVEDPGWPMAPGWESVDQKDDIKRLGLAISRETPNILLSTKIERFFDDTFFERAEGPDDYRRLAILSEEPYSYNFSLRSLDGTYDYRVGDPLPSNYGYVRRVVKIKEPGVAEIVGGEWLQYQTNNPDMPFQTFTIRIDPAHLQSQGIARAYQDDPMAEPVNVTLTDFSAYHNRTDGDAILHHVRFKGTNPIGIGFEYETKNPDLYSLHIDNTPYNLTPHAPVKENISLLLRPMATSGLLIEGHNILDVQFTFENTSITGIHHYDHENITSPPLKTAVVEVAIW